MDICIKVPDDVVRQIQMRWGDLSTGMLRVLAVQAYRDGIITEAEVQRMLNLSSRWQVDKFLKEAQAHIDYTEADLEADLKAIRKLRLQ